MVPPAIALDLEKWHPLQSKHFCATSEDFLPKVVSTNQCHPQCYANPPHLSLLRRLRDRRKGQDGGDPLALRRPSYDPPVRTAPLASRRRQPKPLLLAMAMEEPTSQHHLSMKVIEMLEKYVQIDT